MPRTTRNVPPPLLYYYTFRWGPSTLAVSPPRSPEPKSPTIKKKPRTMWECSHCCQIRLGSVEKWQCQKCQGKRCAPCFEGADCPPHVTRILSGKDKHTTGVGVHKDTEGAIESKPESGNYGNPHKSPEQLEEEAKQEESKSQLRKTIDKAMEKVDGVVKDLKYDAGTESLTDKMNDELQTESHTEKVAARVVRHKATSISTHPDEGARSTRNDGNLKITGPSARRLQGIQ